MKTRGFSLLELLAVVVLLLMAAGGTWPIFFKDLPGRNRKAGIELVMQTLERARWLAITSGWETWIVLWKHFGLDCDALMICQKSISSEGMENREWSALTPWIPLSEGCSLSFGGWGVRELPSELLPFTLPMLPSDAPLSFLGFGPQGEVTWPVDQKLEFVFTTSAIGQASILSEDKISLTRFTGRATYEESVHE